MQPTPRPTNTLALVSLICGVVGWSMAPLVASVIAIVAGHLARAQIRQTGEEGNGFAFAGLALGYSSVLLTCLIVFFALALWGTAIGLVIGTER